MAKRKKARWEKLDDYSAYLRGEHWKQFKARYYREREAKCACCGVERGLHLHHKTYGRLGRERLNDVVPLCSAHHVAVHEYAKAQHHRSLLRATNAFIGTFSAAPDRKTKKRKPAKPKPAKQPAAKPKTRIKMATVDQLRTLEGVKLPCRSEELTRADAARIILARGLKPRAVAPHRASPFVRRTPDTERRLAEHGREAVEAARTRFPPMR